ncbi:hypothetical protein DSECCO2_192980 [anaerobic digester metagenome]
MIRTLIKNSFLFGLGVFVVLVLGEIFLRASKIVPPALNVANVELGRSRRPDLFWVMFNEGFSMGFFNGHGYLGPEYPAQKDDSITRIVLLGDSFVEGFQVFDRNHFRAILENKLNTARDSFEVLNFGRSGFNIRDCYVYFNRFVNSYEPDYTLLFLSNEDLIEEDNDELLPVLQLKDSCLLINDKSLERILKQKKIEPLLHNSYFLNMLNSTRKKFKETSMLKLLFGKFYVEKEKPFIENRNDLGKKMNINKRIVFDLRLQTNLVVVDKIGDLDSTFKKYVDRFGIPVIDINKKFSKDSLDAYFWVVTNKRGHWNNEAHKLVGTTLYDNVSSLKINK